MMSLRKTELILWVLFVVWMGFLSTPKCEAQVPAAAARYRAELTRAAHNQWGLDAPVAVLAAQVHQESGWNPLAVSAVGAQGMAQFMPTTASWWCGLQQLGAADCQPQNPSWALRSLVGYDKWLYDRVSATDACNRVAFALAAYNGGLGWVQRDRRKAAVNLPMSATRWFGGVDGVNAGRSAANFKENRDYPRRILQVLAPVYVRAGWGVAPAGRGCTA